jgi:hypothetical protein
MCSGDASPYGLVSEYQSTGQIFFPCLQSRKCGTRRHSPQNRNPFAHNITFIIIIITTTSTAMCPSYDRPPKYSRATSLDRDSHKGQTNQNLVIVKQMYDSPGGSVTLLCYVNKSGHLVFMESKQTSLTSYVKQARSYPLTPGDVIYGGQAVCLSYIVHDRF